MTKSILMAVLLFTSYTAVAQSTGNLSGKVLRQDGKAAEGASVSLQRSPDFSIVKTSATDPQGMYAFEKPGVGKYFISVTAVGYQRTYSKTITLNSSEGNTELPAIVLTPTSKEMAGVSVTAKKALIEQKIDRTVINVDASIMNTGSSALEVLEKAPGVTVDRDGNISLKGKEGVLIMVDGRPTQLGGADLANLLRNMNSNQLDQIEIMTNPPAKYDASGNAGIINIKTKKNLTAGYNGSATLGFTQGRYPKTNEGFNFNYREGKINLFTNLSHSYRKGFGTLLFNRNIFNENNSALQKMFDQRTDRVSAGNAYAAKVGADYFAGKNTTFGVVINGSFNSAHADNENVTRISNAAAALEGITKATVRNENEWKNFGANFNIRQLLNSRDKEITADLDYISYGSRQEQFMINSFYDATAYETTKADSLMGRLPQDIHVYSGRLDYLHQLKKNARFEAGIKSSLVRTDNNASYDSIEYGNIVHDVKRSNHFLYEENINAAYVNLSTPLTKKLSAQLGLRLENTNAKGKQMTTGENFDRHYTQLFPTAFFQYKANEKNTFGANFGRRVRRPNYQSLNPFIKFIDRYTYSQGNPDLRPSVSNNIELSHTWNNKITTTLNYTHTADIIDGVIEQKGLDAYSTQANIASLRQVGFSVNANTPIRPWWTSNININVFNNQYRGVVSNAPIDMQTTSFIITGTQQFKITKTLSGELNGRYRNGWLEGVMRARPVGFVGAGLSQQVMKNRGTVRITVRDIFYTQKFRGKSQYGNVDFDFQEINESRVVSVGFSYRFNKGKKLPQVKRTAGSANEEEERIGE